MTKVQVAFDRFGLRHLHTSAENLKMRLSIILFILILFSLPISHAEIDAGLSGGFVQENKTVSVQKTATKNFYEVYGLTRINKWNLHVGVSYLTVSSSNTLTEGVEEQLSSANLYFMLRYGFFRKEVMSISFYYNPSIQATYANTGATADKWTGSGMAFQALAHPEVTENFRLVGGILYVSETYNSKSSTSGSSTVESFTRTNLFPVLGLLYSFK